MSRVVTECKFDCKNRFRLFSDKRLEVSKLANMKRRKCVCVCVREKEIGGGGSGGGGASSGV